MAADPLTSATVNDLLNFDSTDDEDPFHKKPSFGKDRDDKPTLSPRGANKRKAGDRDDALGLDSEVKIKKARKPIAKLDEARLLSAPGLPKLCADARKASFLTKKLRIKGKGHEFSDVAKLLNYYQLWLDDLYPRAKFADGLQLIEKAGHTKRMGTVRKEWIDEGKPGYIREREAKKKADKKEKEREKETYDMYGGEAMMSGANNEPGNDAAVEDDSLFVPDSRHKGNADEDDTGLPEDDELDALLAEQETRPTSRPSSASKRIVEDDSEGEDDLEALLAEQQSRHKASDPAASASVPKPTTSPFDEDDDEDMDDLDALLAAQQSRHKAPDPAASASALRSRTASFDEEDDQDMDDLEALLAEQETRSKASPVQRKTAPSTAQSKASADPIDDEFPIDDNEDDELEALIAQQVSRETTRLPPSTSTEPLAPIPTAMHEEVPDLGEDGADMFSSSPVRGTASSRFLPDSEREAESTGNEATNVAKDEEPLRDTQGSKDEESQGLDAGDMFSSSPLQIE